MPTLRRLTAPRPWCLFGLALAAVLMGCRPPQRGGQGPGHRPQELGLTPQQECSLGEQAYREVLGKSTVLPRDSEEVEKVRRVGTRIVKAAQIRPLQTEINLHLEGYDWDWQFNVLRDKQVNAFCLPCGRVGVYTGLLRIVENDSQLATVLAHEIGHALAHHSNERITREAMYHKAVRAAEGSLGQMSPGERRFLIGLLSGGAELRSLKYERQQEAEADHIGLFLMTFAGYDPDQALVFWEEMQRLSSRQGHPPAILSTHPSDAERIANIRKWIPRVKAGKKAYDEGRIAPGAR